MTARHLGSCLADGDGRHLLNFRLVETLLALVLLETTLRRHLTLLERLLRSLETAEELGLSGKNLPLLTKRDGVVHDCLAITRDLVACSVRSHKPNTVGKRVIIERLEVDTDKVLVGLEDYMLALAEVHSVDALLGWAGSLLDVVDRVATDLGRGVISTRSKDAVDPVASQVATHDLKSMLADAEDGSLNVRPTEADLGADVNVHADDVVELGVV